MFDGMFGNNPELVLIRRCTVWALYKLLQGVAWCPCYCWSRRCLQWDALCNQGSLNLREWFSTWLDVTSRHDIPIWIGIAADVLYDKLPYNIWEILSFSRLMERSASNSNCFYWYARNTDVENQSYLAVITLEWDVSNILAKQVTCVDSEFFLH